ncbi:MAG TPA: hypothetical protein DCG12_01955 [Planctomycetaceae bacterium]|nr:hypothetical protein [Planctomycetaceae bacterium]
MRVVLLFVCLSAVAFATDPTDVYPAGKVPPDSRLSELRTLNSYFPFHKVETKEEWQTRQAEIRRRLLVSQGLWPEPTKAPLNAVIHSTVRFGDYTVDCVYFESIPGHYVTGSLYRPRGQGPFPAVLCPHGHWRDARFYDAGEEAAQKLIDSGGEELMSAARNHIQARCVQLARMGCVAFFYDMTGNCDSIQLPHRPDSSDHLDTAQDWGFMGVQAELRLQNMMGLQTWNSVRSIDFLASLPEVDPERIGVTGASGGGTQSMIIAAIDDQIAAAMPCVMVSTAMQGGCSCENAALMRIGMGNVDIAAAVAPRPLGLTAADDWTKELQTKGYPDLKNLYDMLGHEDRLTAAFHIQFPHNYNLVNRRHMYEFFNRHFGLGHKTPFQEQDFVRHSRRTLSVWNEDHPAPSGNRVGDPHEIRILQLATMDAEEKISELVPADQAGVTEWQRVVGGAWETILGRRIEQVGDVRFSIAKRDRVNDVELQAGTITRGVELVPTVVLRKLDTPQKAAVVWITDTGKAAVLKGDGFDPSVRAALDEGLTVIAADLSGQGEFLADGKPLTSQRMDAQRGGGQTWHRFAGYTYGYNHPLFVLRTHDILTVLQFAGSQAQDVHLKGFGSVAGPLVLAARSQAGDAVRETVVDVGDFEFGRLKRKDDPMFVPGAVRYLGVDGLASVCVPHKVTVINADVSTAHRVYRAAGTADQLTTANR